MPGHAAAPESAGLPGTGTNERILTEKQLRELQKRNMIAALNAANWKVSGTDGAAELLGVRPTTLYDRMKTFAIRKPQKSG